MPKVLTGIVTSDLPDKTIVITVRVRRTHPIYKKQYTVNTKFMAHDEQNKAKSGDLVTISEIRPISARKRFKLDKIIERGGIVFNEADATADIPVDISVDEPADEPIAKSKPEEPKAKAKAKPETKEEAQ